jgi:hypothetical protein
MARKNDPRTKEQLLDRMMSFDFDGDIRHLGVEPASIVRVSPNTLRLTFPDSGVTYELSVHRPREFSQAAQRSGESRSFAPSGEEPSTRGLRRTQPEEAPAAEEPRQRKRRKDAGQPRQREQRTG